MSAPLQAAFPAALHDTITGYFAGMAADGHFTGTATIVDRGVHCLATFVVHAELEQTRDFVQSIATIMR